MRALIPVVACAAAVGASACSTFHGLHSARALPQNDATLGAEVTHQSLPAYQPPLGERDPRIETTTVDFTGRYGLGGGTEVGARAGMGGLEGSLLQQLTPLESRDVAFAAVASTRGRIVFGSAGEVWRLLDFVVSAPLEFDPHPRVALIVEPKGMLSLGLGCSDAGSSCDYYPFHAGVSAGTIVRATDFLTVSAEGAWYPLPITEQQNAAARPTSWELSLGVSWYFDRSTAHSR